MKFSERSAKQTEVDITDYYAVKPKAIWRGLTQENAAFWWVCFYTFLEYVRPASLYPVINILPWTQIALIMAAVTAFNDKSVKWIENPVNGLIIIFLIVVLLSSVFAFRPSTALSYIDVAIVWLLAYFLIVTTVNSEKKFFIFVLLFLLINFKMSQHGALSFVKRGFTYTRWGAVGSPGWFRDSGDFGIAMNLFFPLAFSFVLALKEYWGRLKRLFFYLMPLSGVIAIIATSSRGAQLGMVATGFWFLLKSGKGIKAVVGILIVGWALYAILPDEMLEEYRAAGKDNTSQDRLAHWDFGLDVVSDHPFLGIGYHNWLDYCNYMNPHGLGSGSRCRLPHNTYISAASEIGIAGFTLYTVMIIFVFVLNARTRANAEKLDNKFIMYTSHGLDGGVVGYIVSTVFFTVLFYPVFWFQLAMTVALHEISKRQLAVQE